MAKRVVIFGSAGQLGVELVREFSQRNYSVMGYDRATVDIADSSAVEREIAAADPELVVNAAAYNQVDLAEQEPQAAFLVNALAVRNIAVACRQIDARLVHFSTDYVFDGTARQPYSEEDRPHPLGAYAVSKLAGELYAQAYLDNALIIRTSGVFGPGGLHTARSNFVELMLRLYSAGGPIRVVADHIASPTYAPQLARCTVELTEGGHCGVFHVGGGTAISWFDFASMIFRAAGISDAPLRPTSEREYRTAARRPKYSALKNARLEQLGMDSMPPIAAALDMYFAARQSAASS
ncbi:MAG TPA: dTDP-4-dehydrorhamnose reductase [Bryobacteraceae bacterium]|nr:dTDP-4-dehydrorhamnose reductase [Bryobacteraceae bacterium]